MIVLFQTRLFQHRVKRLHPVQKQDLDEALLKLRADPTLGEEKKGDLLGVRVLKFHMGGQLTLLAYEWRENDAQLRLLVLGSHENFYRDLKRH
ncbi:MAG: type II toxin-antitoxin system RelE/ParE family toxin [Magnetococcales bacterium]|nr:type II toxin-antitoxin system RelE/ParE family toxin [Magnetococcales bacterium]